MKILKDPEIIVGQMHNTLLVVKHLGLLPSREYIYKLTGETKIRRERFYLCRCVICGEKKKVRLNNLKKARCQQCKQSVSKHELIDVWRQIKSTNYKKSNGVLILRNKYRLSVCDR